MGLRPLPQAARARAVVADPHGSLVVGDRTRSFAVYAPSPLPPGAPLVIAFHGSGETGDTFRWHSGYGFDRLADAHGFVVAYPDGYGGNWDDCRRVASYPARALHIDDVGFVRALVDHLHATLGIDRERVFATGHSNGGHMAYRLALEVPDEIRAVAPISAGLPTPDNMDCKESGKPIPILIMNGTADPINPFTGGRVTLFGFGDRGNVRSSVDSAGYFVQLARLGGAGAGPTTERLPGGDATLWVERSTWGPPGALEVVLDAVHGGGHVVPQAVSRYPRILGRTDAAFDGPAEISAFFARQRPRSRP